MFAINTPTDDYGNLRISKLVEKLVVNILHNQSGQPPQTENHLNGSRRPAFGDPVSRSVKMSMKILSSKSQFDGKRFSKSAMKKHLANIREEGIISSQNRIILQSLEKQLRHLNPNDHQWALYHLLQLVSVPLNNSELKIPLSSEVFMPPAGKLPTSTRNILERKNLQREQRPKYMNGSISNDDNTRANNGFADTSQSIPDAGKSPNIIGKNELEQLLIRDMLYIVQGIDGNYIKFDADKKIYLINKMLCLPNHLKDLLLSTGELGWLFIHVTAYVTDAQMEEKTIGQVKLAFIQSLQDEITDYYRVLAVVESQIGDGPDQQDGLTLKRLALWAVDPIERLKQMSTLIDGVGNFQGCSLASCLYRFTWTGDPSVCAYVDRVLRRVCDPIFKAIRAWICQGELEKTQQDESDNHDFFICCRSEIVNDRAWSERYYVNHKLLPLFIPKALADTILVAGKAINFMRMCAVTAKRHGIVTNRSDWAENSKAGWSVEDAINASKIASGLQYGEDAHLKRVVTECAIATNSRLFYLVMIVHRLRNHLRALKKFLLLGQGDFAIALYDNLSNELGKRASALYEPHLSGLMDSALKSSVVNFESSDILERLKLKLLDGGGNEKGWDVLSLEYVVEAPITAVLTDKNMVKYRQLFHLLWRVKRVEWVVSAAWQTHMNAAHRGVYSKYSSPAFRRAIHKCAILRSKMTHFATNLGSYMMFEVVEKSWNDLVEEIETAKDLDSVIKAHDKYLEKMMEKSLLGSSSSLKTILFKMQAVLMAVIEYCEIQKVVFRQSLIQIASMKESGVDFSNSESPENIYNISQFSTNENRHLDNKLLRNLEKSGAWFENSYKELLEMLEVESIRSEKLRHLVFRLDFNQQYCPHMSSNSKSPFEDDDLEEEMDMQMPSRHEESI